MERFDLHFSDASRSFLRGCRNSRKYFALWYAFLSLSLAYFHFMTLTTKRKEWSKESELLQRDRVVYVKYYLQESKTPGPSHSLITIMVSE